MRVHHVSDSEAGNASNSVAIEPPASSHMLPDKKKMDWEIMVTVQGINSFRSSWLPPVENHVSELKK